MIIKVNENGIKIDIYNNPDFGEMVRITDLEKDEYFTHHSAIESINGNTNFLNHLDVFNELTLNLYNL